MVFQIVDQNPHAHTVVDRHDEIGDAAQSEGIFPGKGVMKMLQGLSQVLCVQKKGDQNEGNQRGNLKGHIRGQHGIETHADINVPEQIKEDCAGDCQREQLFP